MQNFLFSLVKLVVALFFVVIGLIGLFIPWSEGTRTTLINLLLEDSLAISLFGFSFLLLGIMVIANIIIHNKGKHYNLKTKAGNAEVDESIVKEYIAVYLKRRFPNWDLPIQLNIKKNKIYLHIEFPEQPDAEQPVMLETVKNDLSTLLASKLDYRDVFYFSATFR